MDAAAEATAPSVCRLNIRNIKMTMPLIYYETSRPFDKAGFSFNHGFFKVKNIIASTAKQSQVSEFSP